MGSVLVAVEDVERWSENFQAGLRAGMEYQLQMANAFPGKAPNCLGQLFR